MKPLKLVMSAFGPFRDREEVLFEELGQNGLFLVTGDTGAGKTTIFDAISFALFGNASGENRTTDCFRSDYAENDDKTYVELVFIHKGKKYHLTRNPMYQRNKLRGNGTTEEKANATLIKPDESVISGYYPVTEAIIELLGIDWKQYKQIAMIAQGEFLQLLTTNSSERGIIFRKVFGTQIYDDLQKKLKGMSNRLKLQCEDLDKSILQFLSGIICDEDCIHSDVIMQWKATKDIHQLQTIMELLEVLLNDDRKQYKKEDKHNNLLFEKINGKIIEYTNGERINQLFLNHKQAKKEYHNLIQVADEMKLKEILVQSAKKALYTVKPIEDNYLYIKRELENLNQDMEKQTIESRKLEADLDIFIKLLKEKVTTKPRINELMINISQQKSELGNYDIVIELENENEVLHKKKHSMELKMEELVQRKVRLCKEQVELQNELDKHKNVDRDLVECQNQQSNKKVIVNQINQIRKDYNQLVKEIETLATLQRNYQEAEQRYNAKNTLYQEAENLFLREQAGIIAAELQDGTPCPVCGSSEHPKKAVLTSGAPSEEQLKKDKMKLEKEHKDMMEASSNSRSQKTRMELLESDLQKRIIEVLEIETIVSMSELQEKVNDKLVNEQSSLDELVTKEKILKASIEKKENCEQQLYKIAEELTNQEETQNNYNEEKSETLNKLSTIAGRLETLWSSLQFKTKQEAESKLKEIINECEKLQGELEKIEKNHHNCETKLGNVKAVLEENQNKYRRKKKNFEDAEAMYMDKLQLCGFPTKEKYQEVLMSQEELETLIQTIDSYNQSGEQLKRQMEQLEHEIDHKEEKDLNCILEEQKELEQQKKLSDERMQKIYSRLKMNDDIYHNTNTKYKEQEKIRQEFLVVSELAKTANGELSGKAKIAFEQYVQAFYFNSVINEANKRLYIMSNNQFMLLRKEDPSNLRSMSGLELEVMDFYTGKARSIKSLSGGESFKASLSLALGLSDVIQSFAGGIEVDAMFIDEGFGSLDSNSLEQAIDTLNGLTSGNRLVGIISHVNELKERIDKKIFIEKSMEGSKITLVK